MSDFDDNWQISGSSDPATPDVQPHQVQAPAQPVQAFQPAPQPMQPAAPQMPVQPMAQPVAQPMGQPVAQPVYQQPVAGTPVYQPMPGQPMYQAPVAVGGPMTGYSYATQQQPIQYRTADYGAEREKNLNECARMINHFSPKVDLYQDYEKCKTDIVRYSRSSVAPLVWGIIVSIIGLSLVFSAITANYKDNIIGYSIAAGIFILAGAGLILLFALKKVHNKKKIEELYTQLGELSNQLNLLYNGFSNCILPPEFTDPRILFKLQSLIISGRCVTIGNAINALLSVHNTYMRINQAKAQFQQDTAARFNGTPAFFNAVRYLDLR